MLKQRYLLLTLITFLQWISAGAQATADTVKKELVFLESYQKINSFQQLAQQLKGAPVFIEFWASWCGPCRKEFHYKDALDSFLTANNIRSLYLSMDDEETDARWKEVAGFFRLPGMQMRANALLRNDLSKMIWNRNGSFSIPRFALLNEKGQLINANMLRPSDKEALFEQIRNFLYKD